MGKINVAVIGCGTIGSTAHIPSYHKNNEVQIKYLVDIIPEKAQAIKDKLGLDETDYNLLLSIIEKFNGGPVGIEAIASSIGEEVSTIEDVYEPFLLQNGYLKRTTRGRVVTDKTYKHLGIIKEENK